MTSIILVDHVDDDRTSYTVAAFTRKEDAERLARIVSDAYYGEQFGCEHSVLVDPEIGNVPPGHSVWEVQAELELDDTIHDFEAYRYGSPVWQPDDVKRIQADVPRILDYGDGQRYLAVLLFAPDELTALEAGTARLKAAGAAGHPAPEQGS